jgi:hypothetical protein
LLLLLLLLEEEEDEGGFSDNFWNWDNLWRKWLRKCNNPIREANKRKEPKEREIELPVGYSHTHANKLGA